MQGEAFTPGMTRTKTHRRANVNAQNSQGWNWAVKGLVGWTPLMKAVQEGKPELVEFLISAGSFVVDSMP